MGGVDAFSLVEAAAEGAGVGGGGAEAARLTHAPLPPKPTTYHNFCFTPLPHFPFSLIS